MDRNTLLTAMQAHQDAVREHLTDAINHIIEMGRLADALAQSGQARWYEALSDGAPLRTKHHTVVYTDRGLTKWASPNAEKSPGDTTMQFWGFDGEWIMVARPHSSWPQGLWVRGMDVEQA